MKLSSNETAATALKLTDIPELGWPALGIYGTEFGLFFEGGAEGVPADREQFTAFGRRLAEIGRGYQWCLGDYLNICERVWGDEWTQIVGEVYDETAVATGYDRTSLQTIKWVCDRVPMALRPFAESFEHAKAVAALENEAAREAALKHAAEQNYTRDELRDYVREIRGPEAAPAWPTPEQAPSIINRSQELNLEALSESGEQAALARLVAVLQAIFNWLQAFDSLEELSPLMLHTVRLLRDYCDDALATAQKEMKHE